MIKTIYSKLFTPLSLGEGSGVRLCSGVRLLVLFTLLLSLTSARAQDYSNVYLIGDATPAGWDLAGALRMTPVSGKEAVFSWEGRMTGGKEFKFLSGNSWYWPGFLATVQGQQVEPGKIYDLRYSKDMIDEDYKFVPAKDGDYKITVDLKGLTMTVEQGEAQVLPTELWLEGTAVPGGVQKITAGSGEGSFGYKGQLKKGTLRLMTTATAADNTVYYVPLWENPDVQDGSPLVKTTDAEAEGFWVEVPSDNYRVSINLMSLDITAAPFRAPYNIYLVGGATTAGWNTQDAVPFTQDLDNPCLYTCRTELKIRTANVEPDAFKILGQPDWSPYSLHPTVAAQPITEAERFVENGDDTKWIVPEDKQGLYQITVDLWQGTIKGALLDGSQDAAKGDGTTGVAAAKDGKAFSVSTNGGTVVVDSSEVLSNARLVSLSGSEIAASSRQGNRIVLGRNLAPGVYVVAADTNDGQTRVRKVAVK